MITLEDLYEYHKKLAEHVRELEEIVMDLLRQDAERIEQLERIAYSYGLSVEKLKDIATKALVTKKA